MIQVYVLINKNIVIILYIIQKILKKNKALQTCDNKDKVKYTNI